MTARRRHLPASDPLPSAWAYRRGERLFLAMVLLSVTAGMVVITVGGPIPIDELNWINALPLVLFSAGTVALHLTLVIAGSRCDTRIPALALLLAGIGLVLQTRLREGSPGSALQPADVALPLGMVAMLVLALLFRRGRWRLLAALRWPCLLLAVAVLGAMLVLGQRFRGAVYLPGNLNPTEIIKVLLVLFAAGFIAARQEPIQKGRLLPLPNLAYWALACCWAIPMGLLVVQRDLGMGLILAAVLAMMLWLATGRWLLPVGAAAAAAVATVAVTLFVPHAQRRVAAWINPFDDPTGAGWQVLQGLTALYNGGMWGRGIGEGAPELVPIASSDFVYSAVGEELGFVGCLVITGLILILVRRALRVGAVQTDLFPALMTSGFAGALALQTIVNVGGVVKALPLTGVTLPFISHGGSSLVTSFMMIGLILAVSDQGNREAQIPPP